ncbi:MAG TPA: glycosyltransferase [Polyangiaceae bacterium]
MKLRPVVEVLRSVSRTVVERTLRRPAARLLHRDLWARPLDFERDRVVLLFFEDYDTDRRLPGDRHAVRVARRLLRAARGGQQQTGFGVAYEGLVHALELAGYRVVENDFALARANPGYPVGIAGYTHILDRWPLPNPAVLGPGLFDHPGLRPELMKDRRFRRYIVPCEWMRELFAKSYGATCGLWFAGIDTEAWPAAPREQKDLDFIVYEKMLWDPEGTKARLVEPLKQELSRRGLTFEVLRYKHYDHRGYRALLGRARGMVYLCEHETQGLAYQEGLASGVPILAWDQGRWLDPVRLRFGAGDVPASSVPYFEDGVTGERFRSFEDFPAKLDLFLQRRDAYAPRRWIEEHLSVAASARAYLTLYESALRGTLEG